MKADSLYRLTAACLITHELDSIVKMTASPNSLGSLSNVEQSVLIWGHIPIVLGLLFVTESTMRASVRYGTCVFAVIHVALHWVYRDQPIYDFGSMASWVLILLAGIFGAAYLVPAKAR
ncbi:DUF6713 family protein [Hyphomonas sp.]|uniref:DUF6713 family protein n=1 Tax=Hyphomonas sp. TaxID=87 RepID=UPI003340AFA6